MSKAKLKAMSIVQLRAAITVQSAIIGNASRSGEQKIHDKASREYALLRLELQRRDAFSRG